MATTADIEFHKGEDVVITVTMDPLVVVTGWTIQFKMRRAFDQTVLVTKSASLTNPTSGIFTITIARADTQALDARQYVYDITRTDSGQQAVLTIGNLNLLPEVNL